jgi:hypothetical protein
VAKFRIRSVNKLSEVLKVSGNTVSQAPLKIRPDPLIGIKFRRIPWKVDGFHPGMSLEESLGELGFVKCASVPEKDKRASDLATKVPEEFSDLFASNVFVGVKAGVEPKTLSLGGDCDSRDGRDFRPSSGNNERGCFSFNCPGSLDVGDKREATLIEEDQASFKSFSFFLYGAKRDVSSNESLCPCVPGPASSASEYSIPSASLSSKDFQCNNGL